jgi:hypothetical protein
MPSFTGGEAFQNALRDLGQKLSRPATLRVGFLEGATYPNGQPVAMVAAIQEFGAPRAGIPPRPFFRNMIAARKASWPAAIIQALKDNDYDVKKALAITGLGIAGQLQQSIRDTNDPNLSPVTLMLRKMFGNHPENIRARDVAEARRRVAAGESSAGVSTKPLVWTGHLINSVGSEVKA